MLTHLCAPQFQLTDLVVQVLEKACDIPFYHLLASSISSNIFASWTSYIYRRSRQLELSSQSLEEYRDRRWTPWREYRLSCQQHLLATKSLSRSSFRESSQGQFEKTLTRRQLFLRLCSCCVCGWMVFMLSESDCDSVLAVLYGVLDKILTPFAQPFSVNNISLMYPMADPERVPIWMAMVYSCFCPAVIIAIYTLLLDGVFSKSKKVVSRGQRYTWGDRLWELNCGILGLFLAQGAAFVITGSLKNLIGKPRPDLLFRCKLPANTTDPGLPSFGLVHRANCTQTDAYILQDGMISYGSNSYD